MWDVKIRNDRPFPVTDLLVENIFGRPRKEFRRQCPVAA